MRKLLILASLLFAPASVLADDFWVTQYRAAPGKFPVLLELVKSTDWAAFENDSPIMMRHSQGNHWDLMLMGKHNDCSSDRCSAALRAFDAAANELVDFELSFLAFSPTSWADLKAKDESTGLYHIEMFQAGAGKHDALMRQRVIENDFIKRIGQNPNEIFEVVYGSDFDIFTIGFYENLQSFAKPANVTQEQTEAAAKAAGFKNRADVSFLLRELIVGHQDTLAVKVK